MDLPWKTPKQNKTKPPPKPEKEKPGLVSSVLIRKIISICLRSSRRPRKGSKGCTVRKSGWGNTWRGGRGRKLGTFGSSKDWLVTLSWLSTVWWQLTCLWNINSNLCTNIFFRCSCIWILCLLTGADLRNQSRILVIFEHESIYTWELEGCARK